MNQHPSQRRQTAQGPAAAAAASSPGLPYATHGSSPRTQAYNPQLYAQPSPPQPGYVPYTYAVPPRSSPNPGPQPYNPAAYHSSHTAASPTQTGFPPGAGPGSPYASFPLPPSSYSQPQSYYTSPQQNQYTAPLQEVSSYQAHSGARVPPPLPSRPLQYPAPAPNPPLHAPAISFPGPSFSGQYQQPAVLPSPSPDFHHGHTAASPSADDYGSPVSTRDSPFPPPDSSPVAHAHIVSQSSIPTRSNTSGRHPQARPLPGPPSAQTSSHFDDDDSDEDPRQTNDTLFDEVETMMGAVQRQTLRMPDPDRQAPRMHTQQPLSSYALNASRFPQRGDSTRMPPANVYADSLPSAGLTTYYDDYGDDSDAEAAAGLEAMRMAQEEEEASERRRSSGAGRLNGLGVNTQHLQSPATTDYDSPVDEDYGNVDMSSFGGGFDAQMTYRDNPASLALHHPPPTYLEHHPSASSRGESVQTDTDDQTTARNSYSTHRTSILPMPAARVDEAGTGGLQDPALRRLSFDKDDERYLLDEQTSPGAQPYYQSQNATSHPLPSIPQQQDQASYFDPAVAGQSAPYGLPATYQHNGFHPDQNPFPQYDTVPPGIGTRSHSLVTHSTTQPLPTPARAKTDAEERKRQARASRYGPGNNDSTTSFAGMDLPSLAAGAEFDPTHLNAQDYDQCAEPWALSSVSAWLRKVAVNEQELKEQTVVDGLVHLFNNKVPNMNILHAEALALFVFGELVASDVLIREEEWLRFGQGSASGVIYQLTGKGCYAPSLHQHEAQGRCYSRHCQATVKKLFLKPREDAKQESWRSFFDMSDEDLKEADPKAVKLQNALFEVVTSEEKFVHDMDVFKTLYLDGLSTASPPPLPVQGLRKFIDAVFGKLEAVQNVNSDFLLPQLRYRQQEQGPWVTGFSDIFRDWVRKARHAFIDYISNMPNGDLLVRQEKEKNPAFAKFLEQAQKHKLSQRLGFDHYFKVPSTKLQRYKMLLEACDKEMKEESEEKTNLKTAIEEVKELSLACDALFGENQQKAKVKMLASQLKYRPETQHVHLNLDQLGREMLFSGDLQRTGGSRFTWVETHCILLDNYLVLTKPFKDSVPGADIVQYDVSKIPIPMDLLILESAEDDPVIKSTVKGITTVASTPQVPQVDAQGRLTRTPTSQTARPGALAHTSSNSLTAVPTNASDRTMVTTTVLQGEKDSRLFPFRIRHLGKEVYTLYASDVEQRRQWCSKIIEAKTKHASSLHSQNAEPFKLRVIADAAFAYDTYSGGQKSIMISGTPLSRAVEEVEARYRNAGRPGPVCRARVNCTTTFSHTNGKQTVAIGTDYGVYLSEAGNPRGFIRSIAVLKVTQIAVLEEFNLCLLISDKSLIAYHLDVVAPANGVVAPNDSVKKAPQKLSGNRDVGFFNVGRMKERTLVFYKKRDGLSSTFRILEPVYQKAAEKKSRLHLPGFRGQTEFFRDYDEFYIPTDCAALDLFSTSLAVATAKGFEILNLDKKQPWSVPDLKAPHVSTIAARLHDTEPLAMFRLAADGSELLCVYSECAVYVNRHGDISRSVVMEFVGRARQASLVGNYLILFDTDFVEVRDALNGRLKQIIAGRDVRCLDNGRGGASPGGVPVPPGQGLRTVKFALQHPDYERTQIIVEMLLTE